MKTAAQLLLPLALAGCCTETDTCNSGDIMAALNNAIGSASAAVGAASVAVGLKSGNGALASQGGDLLNKAGDLLNSGRPSGTTQTAAAAPSVAGGSPPPPGPACVAYIRSQRAGYMREAERCHANAGLMTSMQNEDALPKLECRQTYNYIDQSIAQEACGMVYACAAAAYTVALTAAKQGADCSSAANASMQAFPIPKVQ